MVVFAALQRGLRAILCSLVLGLCLPVAALGGAWQDLAGEESFTGVTVNAEGAVVSRVGRFVPEGMGALRLAEPADWGDRGQALRLPGGDRMATVLEVAPSLATSGTFAFSARKDGRRRPFSFIATVADRDGLETEHDLTPQVNASEVSRVVLPLPPGVVSVRFEVTAPKARGVWLDDVAFLPPTPMEVTRVSYVPVQRPLVAGESVIVGALEVETVGALAPLAVEGIRLLEGAPSEQSRLGDAAVDGVGEDGKRPLEAGLNRLQLRVAVKDLTPGELAHVWDAPVDVSVSASIGGVEVEAETLPPLPGDLAPRAHSAAPPAILKPIQFRLARRMTPAGSLPSSVSLAVAPALSEVDGEALLCAVSHGGGGTGAVEGEAPRTELLRSVAGGASWEPLPLPAKLQAAVGASLIYDFLQRRFHMLGSVEGGTLLHATCDRKGEDWTEPRVLDEIEWSKGVRSAGSSGIIMSDGTLVVPVVVTGGFRIEDEDCAGILVSVDGGKSWRLPPAAYPNTSTAAVVEMGDGALMLNMTDGRGGARSDRLTRTLGQTWNRRTGIRPDQIHLSAGGDGALIHVGRARRGVLDARFVFANPATPKKPLRFMTLKGSSDSCGHWPEDVHVVVDDGVGVNHPSLAPVGEEHIGLAYVTSSGGVLFQRFPESLVIPKSASWFDVTGGR